MKNLLRFLGAMGFILVNLSALGCCWVDTYWPLNDGDRWYFTNNVTVGTEDWGGGEYQVWQETEDDYVYEIHRRFQCNVYFDCADAGWIRVCVDPLVLLFDDDLLQNGGRRTTRTTATQSGVDYPATFTVTVSLAGTQTVPAGTFLNCRNVTIHETAYPPGQPAVSATVFTAVLAPRVGLIKKRVAINDSLKWVSLVSGRVGGVEVKDLAALSGLLPPRITAHPRNTTATNQGIATLSVSTSGQGLGYEWLRNETPLSDDGRISGARTATLRINPVQYSDAGTYSVRVSNDVCTVMSSDAVLSVLAADLLVLRTNGAGTIQRSFSGNLLLLGSTHTVTAVPRIGHVFSNWTDGAGVEITNHPTCKFVMRSNLVLAANFVANPFFAAKGTYNGLFYNTAAIAWDNSGFFMLTLTDKGAYSGSLKFQRGTYSISGRFDLALASTAIARSGTNELFAHLQLREGSDQLSGTVSHANFQSELFGFHSGFSLARPATNFAGKLTTLLSSTKDDPAASPVGDGITTITVAPSGRVVFKSTLADGTPAAQSVWLAANGQFPIFRPLYSGRGSIFGWLSLTNETDTDILGPMLWTKPSDSNGYFYSSGFTNDLYSRGSRYTPPRPGKRAVDFTNAVVHLEAGNLTAPLCTEVMLTPAHRFVVPLRNTNKLTLAVSADVGTFSGSFLNPDTRKTSRIKGVVLQKQKVGGGFFLGTNQSGRVYVAP